MAEDSPAGVVALVLSSALNRPITATELVERQKEEQWDSLKHIEMVFAIEAAFNIAFTDEQIAAVRSSHDFVAVIEAQRAA